MQPAIRLLLAGVCLVDLAFAQDPATGPATKVVNGSMGIDFTTQYFLRGIFRENQGFIGQPWFQFGYGLYEGTSELRNLGLTFGLWNSLHDGPTGTGGGGSMWFESDFYLGLSAAIGERISVGATYTSYYSPNQSFAGVEELAFSASYDDKGSFESIASGLQPSVVLAFEVDGQLDAGTPGHPGIYVQFGVKPSFPLGQFTLAVPVTAGFSLKDYYETPGTGNDDFFGFLDLGAVGSTTLTFLPPGMGPWQAELGLHWLFLGDNNEARNVGETTELILSCGFSTTF